MSIADSNYGKALPKVIQTVRNTSSLAAQDVKFHTSLDPKVMTELEKTSKSLLSLANSLMSELSTSFHAIEYGESEIKRAAVWKNITDVLDTCFEKVDLALDTVKDPARRETQFHLLLDDKIEMVPEVTEKPQALFDVKIDNSDSQPFRPHLINKPHALQSLGESMKMVTAEGNETDVHYRHPYEFEIMHQPFPESQLEAHEPIHPNDWASTSPVWVDSVDELEKMVEELALLSEIAVDLEHHDYRSYYGLTCLMQISNREKDWLIDTLALRSRLQILNRVFTDPAIVKVFHGANMDIIWLQRDLGLYVVSLFDTYHASKKLGFPKFSLAYLLETIAHFKTSKKYQLADWRIRPLTPMMTQYARADTHFLLFIYDILRNKLIEKLLLPDVLYDSRLVACRRFEYNKFKIELNDWTNSNFGNSSLKWLMSQYNLSTSKKRALDSLLCWRDKLARENDESPRYILSNQSLVNLCALSLPLTVQNVKSAIGKCSDIVKGETEAICDILRTSLVVSTSESQESEHIVLRDQPIDYLVAFELGDSFSQLEGLAVLDDDHLVLDSSSHFKSFDGLMSDTFSIKYDQLGGATEIPRTEVNNRLQSLTKNLIDSAGELKNNQMNSEVTHQPQLPLASPPEEATVIENDSKEQQEIFTLSKKRAKSKKAIKQIIESEPAFDYSSAENASVLNSIIPDSKSKKRSFDPFSKLNSGGPRPAKRGKTVTSGKSASFKKRKQ